MAKRFLPRLGSDVIVSNSRATSRMQEWWNTACGQIEKQVGQLSDQLALINTAQATANAAQSDVDALALDVAALGDDNILSPQEKASKLLPDVAQLNALYLETVARADQVSVSHATLDAAKADFTNLLNSYNPKWNDTNAATSIYTTALPTARQTFPSGWIINGGLTTASAAPYVTLTDASTTQYGSIETGAIAVTAGQAISAGVVVRKSSTHTTHWITLRIAHGTAGYADAILNPYNGISSSVNALTSGLTMGYEAFDLGSDWYVRLTVLNCTAGNVDVVLYPAVGTGETTCAYNFNATGSTLVRGLPDVAYGDWWFLGRNILDARASAFTKALKQTDNAISVVTGQTANWNNVTGTGRPEDSADVTRSILKPSQSTVFNFDDPATPSSGQFPRDLTLQLMTPSGAMTSGVTWTQRVVTGGYNSLTSASGTTALSVSGGVATLTVSSLQSNAVVAVTATYAGGTKTEYVELTRSVAPAPIAGTTGGGGGGGGGGTTLTTLVSKTSGFTSISNTSWVDVTGPLNGTTPAGATTAYVNVDIQANPAHISGEWSIECAVMRDISGTPTQIGSTEVAYSNWDAGLKTGDNAYFGFGVTSSGLTASTSYTWRVYMRVASGGTRVHTLSPASVSVTAYV